MPMPILNGKRVSKEQIDPAKHRFVGIFRAPSPPDFRGYDNFYCDCGHNLQTFEQGFSHWQMGHFDDMQYVDLNNG